MTHTRWAQPGTRVSTRCKIMFVCTILARKMLENNHRNKCFTRETRRRSTDRYGMYSTSDAILETLTISHIAARGGGRDVTARGGRRNAVAGSGSPI